MHSHLCGMLIKVVILVQVSAILIRPAKDHKYRWIWNWFHHLTGYIVLILGFTNIWIGFKILKPAKGWIIAYGVVFGALIFTTILLEVWKKLTRDGRIDEDPKRGNVEIDV